jgi:trans-2,3-dihydro-3-hydroxyanthranilate isomerase
MELEYRVVDVFTDTAFAGNPLAVVLDADHLRTSQMQTLAAEFRLSETAFPLRPTDAERARGVDYRLRIFTPTTELPFAGHPSVGTAWVMHDLARVPAGRITQACGAGDLPVSVSDRGAELTGGEPSASAPVDPIPLLAAVGLTAADLDESVEAPSRVCGTGIGFGILPVRADALTRCEPDPVALRGFAHPVSDATGVYAVAWNAATAVARARMFAGDVGVLEDPATGSAALALGVWLTVSGLLPASRPEPYAGAARPPDDGSSRYTVVQGVEMGRPSRMQCAIWTAEGLPDDDPRRVARITVSGSVVAIASGRVTVPSG